LDAAFGADPPSDPRVISRRAGDPSATRWTRRPRDRERQSSSSAGEEGADIDEDGNLVNMGILNEGEEDLLDANMQANEEAEINRAILLSLRDGQRQVQEPAFFYSLPSAQTAVAVQPNDAIVGVGAGGGIGTAPREEDIQSLEAMGFSRDKVIAALAAKSNNIEVAADHLLNGGEG
jgi:hypothetical protein